MLIGGLRRLRSSDRITASTYLAVTLSDGTDLRYFDQKRMGMVYYLRPDHLDEVPRLTDQGVDVLDSPLTLDELRRLHAALREIPARAVGILRQRVGTDIYKKVRDFLAIHGKGDMPCPRCAGPITSITANQRLTNYCRRCQSGSLFRG